MKAELSASSEPAGNGELLEAAVDTGAATDDGAALDTGTALDAGPPACPLGTLPQAPNSRATPTAPTSRSLITMP
jgi:hypothetical protein